MSRKAVTVQIRGREYSIRSDQDEASLQRVARYLDQVLGLVEKRTRTVDSEELALLTALNLARDLVDLREERQALGFNRDQLMSLIEMTESALAGDS